VNGLAVVGVFMLVTSSAAFAADGQAADPRLREVLYDPKAVVTVPVKRGVVTLIVLDADESITDVVHRCSVGRT
jgi:type IV secretion system protein VirB9